MSYQVIRHQHLFQAGVNFQQCHASNLVQTKNKTLVCVWFGGSREGAEDVDIWLSRLVGGEWSAPIRVATYHDGPCWNPVLLSVDDELLLYYKVGRSIRTWQTYVKTSSDDGLTWSDGKELVTGDEGGRGPVKNKCIYLKNGRILAPASLENQPAWSCFVDISDDNAATWRASEPVPFDAQSIAGSGLIQPTLWQDDQGIVHMLMRSSEGYIYQSSSQDFGESWSVARRTRLPNNNCGIDVTQLDDGRLVLVFNPVSGDWGARTPISFSVSEDNGVSWSSPNVLDHEPCVSNRERAEFSYPSVIADGRDVHISYTWKRRTIAYWQIRFSGYQPNQATVHKDTSAGPISKAVNWTTMITPFTNDGHEIDYAAAADLIEWYLDHGVDGLFAVCQSSEMFFLTLDERIELARFVIKKVNHRVPVAISGQIATEADEQLAELKRLTELGADAVVLLTNRYTKEGESDDIWKANVEAILKAYPDEQFGLYECPYPYKKVLSADLFAWCVETDRFVFLKDTSCDLGNIRSKINIAKNSKLRIFNANTATLLESLRLGVSGYSGVMNNFVPELYAYLIRNWSDERQIAEELQQTLTAASLIELRLYPMNAKYALSRRGVPMSRLSRSIDPESWNRLVEIETEAVCELLQITLHEIRRLTEVN